LTARVAAIAGTVPAAGQRRELALTLRPEHYPFWSQDLLEQVVRVDLFAAGSAAAVSVADKAGSGAAKDPLTRDPVLDGLFVGKLTKVALPGAPTGEMKRYFDAPLDDLWANVIWTG
jgi:hypothetical protein